MLNIIRANRFVKDLRLAIRRGFKIELLDEVVTKLANQEKLPERYCDHPLLGNYKDFRECHIHPLSQIMLQVNIFIILQTSSQALGMKFLKLL